MMLVYDIWYSNILCSRYLGGCLDLRFMVVGFHRDLFGRLILKVLGNPHLRQLPANHRNDPMRMSELVFGLVLRFSSVKRRTSSYSNVLIFLGFFLDFKFTIK